MELPTAKVTEDAQTEAAAVFNKAPMGATEAATAPAPKVKPKKSATSTTKTQTTARATAPVAEPMTSEVTEEDLTPPTSSVNPRSAAEQTDEQKKQALIATLEKRLATLEEQMQDPNIDDAKFAELEEQYANTGKARENLINRK
jgi:hypothetical protein